MAIETITDEGAFTRRARKQINDNFALLSVAGVGGALASTDIIVGSGAGVATARAMSGDATIGNTGVVSISGGGTNQKLPVAVGAGYKIARGVAAVTAAGTGVATVVTGLTTVVAIVVTMQDDPTTTCESMTATIGDQTSAPVAGSVYIKGWKTFGGTPVPMTTTSVSVNWFAIGT